MPSKAKGVIRVLEKNIIRRKGKISILVYPGLRYAHKKLNKFV